MAAKQGDPEAAVRAAFELAARLGWRHVTLAEIAQEAGMSLADLHASFPSKEAILAGFARMIDDAVLSGAEAPAEDETIKDRLFDVLMRRFDAMKPYKDGIAAILRGGAGGPFAIACGLQRLQRSMAWSLEAAGVNSSGPAGQLKAKGLGAVYLSTLRVWLRDETEDSSRTMAALDRGLTRADSLASTIFRGRRAYGPAGDAPPADGPAPDAPGPAAPDPNGMGPAPA